LLDAAVHPFFFDKLTAFGGGEPFFNGGKKLGFVVQIAEDDVLEPIARGQSRLCCPSV
jgi:hypothetical protein